jgi:hypothetical protein
MLNAAQKGNLVHSSIPSDNKNILKHQKPYPSFDGRARGGRMEQRAFKNVNNYLNINIYSYLETSGGQSSNLYVNVSSFFQHQS